MIDLESCPQIAIKELICLFGKPKDGWRTKDDRPKRISAFTTRAISEIGTQLSNHTRIQSMKLQMNTQTEVILFFRLRERNNVILNDLIFYL